jgi:cytochrome c biogenesis protein CcmG/thiol:disulfide interchange protein DsbE
MAPTSRSVKVPRRTFVRLVSAFAATACALAPVGARAQSGAAGAEALAALAQPGAPSPFAPTLLAKTSGRPRADQRAKAPAFELPTRDGTVSLASLSGRVVIVDFWASWCGPCRQSFPWMAAMHERLASKGLSIVAVNLDKERSAANGFLADYRAPFTVAFDPEGKTAGAYKVKGMPTTFVISTDGRVLYSHIGFDPKRTGEIEAIIQEALPR